jgi:site-specific recombinase XerD
MIRRPPQVHSSGWIVSCALRRERNCQDAKGDTMGKHEHVQAVYAQFDSRRWSESGGGKSRPKPKRRFPPEVLKPEEVKRLLDACGDSPTGVRNRALLAVLYRSGLRINEALTLLPKDLDPAQGAIRVLHAKGGKSRTVGMDAVGWRLLDAWLTERVRWGIGERAPVFCMHGGSPLTPSYVRVLLPRLGVRAGLVRRVHAHALRHTFAAELRSERVDIGIISKQLGHTSIATTARYLDHIAPYSVVEAIVNRYLL